MKKLRTLLLGATAVATMQVTALATVNPDTGDHSIVPVAIGIAVVAIVVLGLVIYLTRNKD